MNTPIPREEYGALMDAFRLTFGRTAKPGELIDIYLASGSNKDFMLEALRAAWIAIHKKNKTVSIPMVISGLRKAAKSRARKQFAALSGMAPDEATSVMTQAAIDNLTQGGK